MDQAGEIGEPALIKRAFMLRVAIRNPCVVFLLRIFHAGQRALQMTSRFSKPLDGQYFRVVVIQVELAF